ncbi:unnamed protein product [Rotaria sp. Silwood2]|nr:unnamed protein product [Rotaria sp. Silwood2]CAF4420233.1 unnamed protein product [Rotaria sp. Silwood2]CAF4520854.1 unnamed protein product [Rotaria sp. Silwood2]
MSKFIQKLKKPKKFEKLLKEIKSIENIVIIQAGKGGKIVIMDKIDYSNKIEEKLNDLNIYEQVKKDPTTTIRTEINKMLTKLLNQNKITEQNKFYLASIDDLPKIRGQPKLHKTMLQRELLQLRTILNGVVCNTSKFVKNISNIKLDQDNHLASLDIQNLYTNIPVNKAIDITLKRVEESNKLKTLSFTKTDIKDLLNLALKNSYFECNGKYYKQKAGLPMGNALSPLLVGIYVDEYQKTTFI